LDSIDVVILLNITLHWWEMSDLPHPRPSTIAKRMGIGIALHDHLIVSKHGTASFKTMGLL
jgi:hypothetical protein